MSTHLADLKAIINTAIRLGCTVKLDVGYDWKFFVKIDNNERIFICDQHADYLSSNCLQFSMHNYKNWLRVSGSAKNLIIHRAYQRAGHE